MFDGVPEQLHQFIAPRNSLPLHLPFPPFDAYNPSSQHHLPLSPPNLLSPLHRKGEQHDEQQQSSMNSNIHEGEPQLGDQDLVLSTWPDDEVLALLRIRSGLDACFPELTWEHVSRKLAELGFKRSAEKCKEKFEEEEASCFNNIHYTKNNGCRFISELEPLYQIPAVDVELGSQESKQPPPQKPTEEQHRRIDHALEDASGNDASLTQQCEETVKMMGTSKRRKRKRHDKFENLKGFCENMVNEMMAKQEQMHNKLLEDMFERDREILARDEAWKKREVDRMNWELDIMAKEQAVAGQRQAAIIDLLKKISDQSHRAKTVDDPNPNSLAATSLSSSQNPSPCCNYTGENSPEPPPPVVLNYTCEGASDQNPDSAAKVPNPSSNDSAPALTRNPNTVLAQTNELPEKTASTHRGGWDNCGWREKEEVGRRWPREEVMALINLRSSANEEREGGSSRTPLWERISEGMREMGYRRSAKRCKEKWENINKYFRKTKHLSKKRSVDSRTCPYFHQLASLYSQGNASTA
ncbi:trihelix transcription factor GTL2 [Neltuma alba]|uniref:trihelix transcription factor GTL2 n=1 Tax=Neltuma alba TaxID=207710 RepID=UPI0010A4D835|nr:trihelix transcription factor GTL2-like [Prosopis alba]